MTGALLNVAMIGTGTAAELLHGPALRAVEGARLWSVCSRKRDRAMHFAETFRAASPTPAYDNLSKCLSDPRLDAVLIATPDAFHAGAAVLAAQAKKHVLCEKPLSTSTDDAEMIVATCKKAGVRLGVAYHHRFHPGHRIVATLLKQKALGDLKHMRVQWTFHAKNDTNWRSQRETARWWSLAGSGTHGLDLIRWWMLPSCGEVDQVRSITTKATWKGANEETAMVLLRFENGATAELLSSVLFDSPRRVEVFGTLGSALCEDTLGPDGAGTIQVGPEAIEWRVVNPYVAQLQDFVLAVRDGRDPEVTGEEGLRNVEIMLHAAGPERTPERSKSAAGPKSRRA